MAKERGGAMPIHQLLVYPVTDWSSTRPSHVENGLSPTLLEANLPWFSGLYFADQADSRKPFASPINATDLKGLPPATVITADLDVLRDDGTAYAKKLQAAGVPVASENYPGMLHEFFGMGAAVDQARKAEGFAAGELKKAFAGPATAAREPWDTPGRDRISLEMNMNHLTKRTASRLSAVALACLLLGPGAILDWLGRNF